jgi:thiol-disulfide isomerase/thioredoxin
MRNVWRRLGIGVTAAAVVLCGAGWAGLHLVEHRIAGRMRAPDLHYEPEPADDLVYATLNGEERHLADTKGRVVFLDLWGTWCIQCVVEMPTVEKLYQRYKDDPQVTFLIVSRLDTPATVRAYARRNHYVLPFYVMRDEDIPESMRLNQYPAAFLYAKDGSLVAHHVGAADWSSPEVAGFIEMLKRQ